MFLINTCYTFDTKIDLQSQSGYGKCMFLLVSNTLISVSLEWETIVKGPVKAYT